MTPIVRKLGVYKLQFVRSKPKRRALMLLVTPLVFVEYIWNAVAGFIRDFGILWNYDVPPC